MHLREQTRPSGTSHESSTGAENRYRSYLRREISSTDLPAARRGVEFKRTFAEFKLSHYRQQYAVNAERQAAGDRERSEEVCRREYSAGVPTS